MDNDRWSGFGWGVALGLLIGLALAGGYCWPRIVAAESAEQAAIEAARAEAERQHALAEMEVALARSFHRPSSER